ncbi:Uncharacterised protein [Niallia circulans]|nr:iron-containing alcohol dehydrogenase [Niallia circulans]MDR4316176.1 iron-containing alcohol dehydrogenase [Niallia circulans]MED3837378.1 iron-containing alcohol dehydrogenase [Niallia circulans]MED4244556.1 iron-containing alcohol dehydrogenase [Niallia circulans]MED4249960.1 iron-containing alcohol dehydrogenase [Niallia circulans]MED5098758.1 iron-containing alcohol dehydrogenase [Niallia circulans]
MCAHVFYVPSTNLMGRGCLREVLMTIYMFILATNIYEKPLDS